MFGISVCLFVRKYIYFLLLNQTLILYENYT